jgi:hypothetical protein
LEIYKRVRNIVFAYGWTPEVVLENKGEHEDVPTASPPPEGSSRATGGVLRGRAIGNVLNLPDAPEVLGDALIPARGTLKLFSDLSHRPSTHKPIMTLKTEAKPTLGPILQRLARGYSPVRSEYLWHVISSLIISL